jgi:putative ATPase
MNPKTTSLQPLAARLRPQSLAEFVGQSHLLSPGKPLRLAIDQGIAHSMILWGPPGIGKTTLARIIAKQCGARFETLSATASGVKEIRAIVEAAHAAKATQQQATILFVDEVHRFNKSQQDAFLPEVEEGTLILIGATTENPSFELNNALLSRARVYVLHALSQAELVHIIQRALNDAERGVGQHKIDFPIALQHTLAAAADGDGRRVLNLLERVVSLTCATESDPVVTEAILKAAIQETWRRFDKGGEDFYDQISALHKAVRGSSPDAALYWLARMLDGGCDPLYIARRTIRMATEDIGNADPRALQVAVNACEVYERLGSPEGELAIAQAIVYMACAPKSNAVYVAFQSVMQDVKRGKSLPVPLRLRNAPTNLMKSLDYGKHYRYAHDEPEGYAAGENYFPDDFASRIYYRPVSRGLEIKIAEKLKYLRELDEKLTSN